MEVINNVKSDPMPACYALAHLDGILEDSRTRVKIYSKVMNDFKSPRNIIKELFSFINRTQ